MSKDNLREQVDLLYDAPVLIKLAKEIIQYLPKGEDRDTVIKAMLNVKKSLIDLDVILQDIEWGMLQYELNKNFQ